MSLEIRKIIKYHETTLVEGGKGAAIPMQLFSAAAVIKNPWAGKGYVEDLGPEMITQHWVWTFCLAS